MDVRTNEHVFDRLKRRQNAMKNENPLFNDMLESRDLLEKENHRGMGEEPADVNNFGEYDWDFREEEAADPGAEMNVRSKNQKQENGVNVRSKNKKQENGVSNLGKIDKRLEKDSLRNIVVQSLETISKLQLRIASILTEVGKERPQGDICNYLELSKLLESLRHAQAFMLTYELQDPPALREDGTIDYQAPHRW